MRTIWLYTNTSTRWRWNLDQQGQILWLLQVCLCVKPFFYSSFFVTFTSNSVFHHCCVQDLLSLSAFVPKNLHESSSKYTLITSATTVSKKCKDIWIIYVPFFFGFVLFVLLDQTPTPTRFLKNCEEVGLFNELASSFEQDEDDKRAKHSVRMIMS